jgi:hypothetical protein
MSQDNWDLLSLLLQVWGLVVTVPFTLLWRRRKWALATGPVLMFIVNFVAQVVLAGGGPGACVGAFVLPACGLFLSWATLTLAKWFERTR